MFDVPSACCSEEICDDDNEAGGNEGANWGWLEAAEEGGETEDELKAEASADVEEGISIKGAVTASKMGRREALIEGTPPGRGADEDGVVEGSEG